MPDESCRSCGGTLKMHSQCKECRKAIQKVCQNCNALTRKQFHDKCYTPEPILNIQSGYILETVQTKVTKQKVSQKRSQPSSIVIAIGIIGLLALGFVGADVFQSQQPNAETMNPDNIPTPQVRYTTAVHDILQNCLAYGSGESVTVTCPTQYGYVYKAILDMPKDLAAKFSDSVFSIRGVSIAENSDGTVTLQYQNTIYLTGFFAS